MVSVNPVATNTVAGASAALREIFAIIGKPDRSHRRKWQ
jgi:hypothetical protein